MGGLRGAVRLLVAIVSAALVSLAAPLAWASTVLEAPVGGKAIPIGEGRVACAASAGEWTVEPEGHAVRPPTSDDAVGRPVDLAVATAPAGCATPDHVTLVATGRWPTLDPASVTFFVDEGRVEIRGKGLKGLVVAWRSGERSGQDRCATVQVDGAGERCAVAVGRGLSADPLAGDVSWAPAGGRADGVIFDASGRRAEDGERVLRPSRVVLTSLVPAGGGVDLAGGTASRIVLTHPEAVVGADCGAASCEVSGGGVVVRGLSTVGGSLPVRLRLAPRVFFQRPDGALDPAPLVPIPILPCPLAVVSGDALRGVDATRVVVRLDARCAGEARALRWYSAGRAVDPVAFEDVHGAAFVLLAVGRVEGEELVVTATRGGADGSTVGQARVRAREAPVPHASLTLEGGEPVDFVPTNRPADAHWARASEGGELVLLPLEGVYEVRSHDGATTVQGLPGAGGLVALRFGWRATGLPGALAQADLAVVQDPAQRPVHEAAVDVPLAGAPAGPAPIVELVCGDVRVAPGVEAHVRHDQRDACRVVFHRERLPPSAGAQSLQLDVDVVRVDGQPRTEAHVSQPLVLRAGPKAQEVWIKGVVGAFDRATVRVSRALGGSLADRPEPSVQWAVVFGTSRMRLYATTAIPTGLYRFSDRTHSGILSLNLGGLMRATWLDSAGNEGFLAAEVGAMAVGLPNDQSPQGQPLTQASLVTGLALSVPIANRSLATETSINLHAWFEYEISRDVGGEPGSPFGFVFGPSISIGNVGTNL